MCAGSTACEHTHRLAKALERTLRTQGVLPARASESLAQRQQVFVDVPVLLLDATERPQHGPSWTERPTTQAKKRLTRKNTLVADQARYIHYLGPTTGGAMHDYQLLKKEFDVNLGLLDLFELLADLGYLGLVAEYDCRLKVCLTVSPDAALTDAQRADTCLHARRRVKVEHAISGAKRLGCVAQTCRNKSRLLQRPPVGPGLQNLELAPRQAKRS